MEMEEYQLPYWILWRGIAAALEAMEQLNFGMAKELLQKAHQDAEEAYANAPSPDSP